MSLPATKKKANKEFLESKSSAILSLLYKVNIKSTFEYRHEVCGSVCVGGWVGGCGCVGGWSSWDGGVSRLGREGWGERGGGGGERDQLS